MACIFANPSDSVARGPEVCRSRRQYHRRLFLLVLLGRFSCVSGLGLPVGRGLQTFPVCARVLGEDGCPASSPQQRASVPLFAMQVAQYLCGEGDPTDS